ncbi:hypothetical protein OG365_40995 (plasmid) [Streptomyces sp. NBC_00853]|uniref:hypothetical protein n=1 Tax=Streptomyces sp. NBC_00853 TaxID=2903681 RepID=UPI002F91A159|nr:hypothetical protein OG365_40995 [Streptomyces sp. NBC_00853]
MVGAGRAAVGDLALAEQLEEFVGAGHQVGGVHVEAAGEFEQDADGQVGEFFQVDLVLVDAEEVGELPAGHPGGQEAPLDDVRSLNGVAAPLPALAAKASAGGHRLDLSEPAGPGLENRFASRPRRGGACWSGLGSGF